MTLSKTKSLPVPPSSIESDLLLLPPSSTSELFVVMYKGARQTKQMGHKRAERLRISYDAALITTRWRDHCLQESSRISEGAEKGATASRVCKCQRDVFGRVDSATEHMTDVTGSCRENLPFVDIRLSPFLFHAIFPFISFPNGVQWPLYCS